MQPACETASSIASSKAGCVDNRLANLRFPHCLRSVEGRIRVQRCCADRSLLHVDAEQVPVLENLVTDVQVDPQEDEADHAAKHEINDADYDVAGQARESR